GETYLGGDERGEGKNGIQLAKKTTLEKGSTINVSGKEKGGRAIVWGDIALIDGNINAQGKDIAKTGGFVETSGHYLSIDSNAIVKTKEWLLDPDNVTIEAPSAPRTDDNIDSEFLGDGTENNPKVNNQDKTILTNTTISNFLKNAQVVNITAKNKITVNSTINAKSGSHLILWSEGNQNGGIEIKKDILIENEEEGLNLTAYSGGWLDVKGNISVGKLGNINLTAKQDIGFDSESSQTITGQGVITSGDKNGFRFKNVSLNGVGATGLLFTSNRRNEGNISNKFDGTLNISGKVNISMKSPWVSSAKRYNGRTYWNLTSLNVSPGSKFNFTIDSRGNGGGFRLQRQAGLNGITFNKNTTFNIAKGSTVNFDIKTSILPPGNLKTNYALFNGNVSVIGGGRVDFNVDASSSSFETSGVIIKSSNFNVSQGSSLNFNTQGSTKTAFLIENDLTLNATGGNITLRQIEGTDSFVKKGIVANKNITFEGGNITFGSQKATTEIKGDVIVKRDTNAILRGAYYGDSRKALNITGNVTNEGNLTTDGSIINIGGNLTVAEAAKLQAITNYTFNVSGLFDNKGNSNISIAKGGAQFKDINNTSSLNITTNSDTTYRTIIKGNISNKSGDLNIIDRKSDAEIQIGGNISQREGNLTISSDRIDITKQITIKKGVNGEDSTSSETNNANLTIKTKELKLTGDLDISGFDKAEIVAKNGSDLTIGNGRDSGSANAKKVTFNNVKDSKISANDHNVTLNSKVETSGDSSAESSDGRNAGLTINAKNVEVNNNITSNKTVNITASENVTTKAEATINATNGNVKVTTKTGDIKGGIESSSGSVTIAATGDTLAVGNISGSTVTVTANKGKLTTTEGSTINATANSVDISVKEGDLQGTVEAKQNSVNIVAKESDLTVSNVTAKNNVAVKAEQGTLTTTSSGTIKSEERKVELTARSGSISGNVVAEKDSVAVTANAGDLSVANVTGKTATLTAESGKLTTQAGSTVRATNGVTASSQSGDIGGTISGKTVSVTATTDSLTVKGSAKINATEGAATLTATKGTLTTAADSSISAASGILTINAKDAKLDGAASGNHTVVNATNASGSGRVIATASSSVNITGDLNTINGLNIISKNGKNTVVLKGAEIDVKYIQPGVASVEEVIEAKRVLEKVKDLSDEERETLAKLGVSAVRFVEPNNAITINTQNEFTTRPSSQVTISEGKACFSSGDGAAVCTNVADDGQQ
ncbi:TPA: beta strand repeat-containing protein, partial [Haemophilus influenzae]